MALRQAVVMTAASVLLIPVAAAEAAAAANASNFAEPLVSLRGASGVGSATSQSCTASYSHDCRSQPTCCEAGFTCYEKDEWWAACRDQTCTPGAPMVHDDSRPWTCRVLGGQPPRAQLHRHLLLPLARMRTRTAPRGPRTTSARKI